MTTTVTFTDGASPITIRSPRVPEVPGRSYPQIYGLTMNGGDRIADMGDGSSIWKKMILHFKNMTNADKTSMQTFLESTVLFGKTLFSYTDPRGTTYTNMRYISGWEKLAGVIGNRWDWDLVIKEDMDP